MRISDWSSDVCSSDLSKSRLLRPTFNKRTPIVLVPDDYKYLTVHHLRDLYDEGRLDDLYTLPNGYMDPDISTDPVEHYDDKEMNARSEEWRVGKAGVSPCRSRGSAARKKKKKK